MELNFSELDKVNTMNPYDHNSYSQQNGDNYWDNPKNKETNAKKKKVSFDDILTNMNLVVNNQGVLQFMAPNQEASYNPPTYQNYNYNPNEFSRPNFQQPSIGQPIIRQPIIKQPSIKQSSIGPPQQNKNSEPLDPSVKHSYIYNKYFKDYVDPNRENPGPRIPKTKEEYYQMLLDDRKKAIEHKIKMEQIKSKKLMFTTSPDATGVNPRNIIATKNNLRSMNFR
jgi:hypothetical protein